MGSFIERSLMNDKNEPSAERETQACTRFIPVHAGQSHIHSFSSGKSFHERAQDRILRIR